MKAVGLPAVARNLQGMSPKHCTLSAGSDEGCEHALFRTVSRFTAAAGLSATARSAALQPSVVSTPFGDGIMSCSTKGHTPDLALRTPVSRESHWPWPDWFRDLAPGIARLWRMNRERQRLLDLDEHLLRDIGLTREQAEKEAARWLWDWTIKK